MCVYKSINAVSAELAATGIAKGRKNQQQGYSFRGIDEVLNALAPLLAKHHLVIAPRILERTVTERPSKSGGITFGVCVRAEFDFIDAADGSKHTVATYGEAMDSADKATNKAMSAAYKYAAFLTFCIPLEGADDADAHGPDPAWRDEGAGSPDPDRRTPNVPVRAAAPRPAPSQLQKSWERAKAVEPKQAWDILKTAAGVELKSLADVPADKVAVCQKALDEFAGVPQ
jgi:hypothetical protein